SCIETQVIIYWSATPQPSLFWARSWKICPQERKESVYWMYMGKKMNRNYGHRPTWRCCGGTTIIRKPAVVFPTPLGSLYCPTVHAPSISGQRLQRLRKFATIYVK